MTAPLATVLAVLVLSVGCAGPSALAPPQREVPADSGARAERSARPAECDPGRDRAAILAMAGTFEVSFAFDETEALTPGYQLQEPYRADATEHVAVLEASAQRVVLQHVLMIAKHSGPSAAMKHWRQDWIFQDRELLEYRGRRSWQHRTLEPAAVRCTWSQAVFEVDDGPRYESYGHFVHDPVARTATWVSAPTWRPLPRREYSQRSDYDVLVAENRHVIGAQGWLHAQENVKRVLDGDRALAREHGENHYRRVTVPEAAIAQQFLSERSGFWAQVRAEWLRQLARGTSLRVHQELAGTPLHARLFPLAETLKDAPAIQQGAEVHALVAPYVEVLDADARAAGP